MENNECPIRVLDTGRNDEVRLCGYGRCLHPLLKSEKICPCHESPKDKSFIEQLKAVSEPINDSLWYVNPKHVEELLAQRERELVEKVEGERRGASNEYTRKILSDIIKIIKGE